MQKFYFEETTNTYQQIFGHLLFVSGCFLTIAFNSAFLIAVFIGIKLLTKDGAAFKANDNHYKLYKNILGIRLGYWQRMPKAKFITLIAEQENEITKSVCPYVAAKGDYVFRIHLYYSDRKHIKIYKTNNIDEAYKTLFKLSKILNTKVYDSLQEGWL